MNKNKNISLVLIYSLILSGCIDEITVPLDEIICLTESAGNHCIANGHNTITVHAMIPEDSREGTTVQFGISEGMFLGAGQKEIGVKATGFDNSIHQVLDICTLRPVKVATASFIAPNSMSSDGVLIVATVAEKVSASIKIRFERALTDTLWMIADKFLIDSSGTAEVTLQGFMKSGKGIPSLGTQIDVTVTEMITGKVVSAPRFRNYNMLSDSVGKVSTIFSALNLGYKGDLLISFYVHDDPEMCDSVVITVM